MVEIKMTFLSADAAAMFLAERSGLVKSDPQPAVERAPAPTSTKAAADPKPVKAQKAEAASPSAVTAETVSAAAEPAVVASPPPPATTVQTTASTAKPLEYASSDLPKRIAEMVGLGHTAAVKGLLAEFGAKKGPEIPAERLGEFDEKLKALETGLTAA